MLHAVISGTERQGEGQVTHREGAAPAAHAYWRRAVGFLKTLQFEETGDTQLIEGRPGW